MVAMSIDGLEMLRPSTPRDSLLGAPFLQALSTRPHSTTSKLTSKPQAETCCWISSFIGSGCICPEPEVEIITFTGMRLPSGKPAEARSCFAFAGSYLYCCEGLPKLGCLVET